MWLTGADEYFLLFFLFFYTPVPPLFVTTSSFFFLNNSKKLQIYIFFFSSLLLFYNLVLNQHPELSPYSTIPCLFNTLFPFSFIRTYSRPLDIDLMFASFFYYE